MTSLKGKTLFVSGGSRGIGLASRNSGSSCRDDQRVTPTRLTHWPASAVLEPGFGHATVIAVQPRVSVVGGEAENMCSAGVFRFLTQLGVRQEAGKE